MADAPSPDPMEQVRAAEITASLCLATDLAMGFPWEHGLAATMSAMRLCDLVGVDAPTRQQAYYLSLLTYVGCTADAAEKVGIYGGPITESIVGVIWGSQLQQLQVVVRMLPTPGASAPTAAGQLVVGLPRALAHHRREQLALCEVAQLMSKRLGLPESVSDAFHYLTDRWDGAGALKRARGADLPLALRIALLARDASYLASVGGSAHAGRLIEERAGKAHDPHVATLLARNAHEVLEVDHAASRGASTWDAVLAAEPEPRIVLVGDQVDQALAAMGDFSDLLTPSRSGHASAVAALAERAAATAGMSVDETVRVRRTALVQDIGRVSVPARVWEKPGALSPDEWEQVRLHPYYSERVCSPSEFLRELGTDAACHHERLDGSGYHRGVGAEVLPMRARILGAADALQALVEPRADRLASSLPSAVSVLARDVEQGRMDTDAVAAVVDAAGGDPPVLRRPAGLTEREAQVVGLLARGLATKQVGRVLGISAKTADRHIQHAYRKIGVSSRAAATLFAMEHGLVAWGELPIGRRAAPI